MSASRSPPVQVPKKIEFRSFFSQSGALWCHFWLNFRSLEALWERWGELLMPKSSLGDQRCPKRRHPRNPFIFVGPIWESCFECFLFFWHLFSSLVGLHFHTIFEYVFIIVYTSDFSVCLEPFHSKTRFLQVRGHQL